MRLVDDADIAWCGALPKWGGHPALLDEATLGLARWMLMEGKTASHVAELLEFAQRSSFSDAFLRASGERPSEFQERHGVAVQRRLGGQRCLRPRKIHDRTHLQPLPKFTSKKSKVRLKIVRTSI